MRTIREVLDNEYATERGISTLSLTINQKVVRAYGTFLGRTPTLDDLNTQDLSRYLRWVSENRRPATAHSYRGKLLCVWRFCYDLWPTEVAKPKLRPAPRFALAPKAWTADEVSKILDACKHLKGRIRTTDISRAWWWSTLVSVAWETGLRRGDIQRLTLADIGSGEFLVSQHKTGKLVRCRISSETLLEIQAQAPGSGPVWGHPMTDTAIGDYWTRLLKTLNVPYGPLKRLRKSEGNWAELHTPGTGHRLLGNTRAVFDANYADPLKLDDSVPRPPRLGSDA